MEITDSLVKRCAAAMRRNDPMPLSMFEDNEVEDLARACLVEASNRLTPEMVMPFVYSMARQFGVAHVFKDCYLEQIGDGTGPCKMYGYYVHCPMRHALSGAGLDRLCEMRDRLHNNEPHTENYIPNVALDGSEWMAGDGDDTLAARIDGQKEFVFWLRTWPEGEM